MKNGTTTLKEKKLTSNSVKSSKIATDSDITSTDSNDKETLVAAAAAAAIHQLEKECGSSHSNEAIKRQESSSESNGSKEGKEEHKFRKVTTRFWWGLIMLFAFSMILYAGHVYICLMVALCQLLTFRELVRVRYNTFFHIIQSTIPLFRTTQWMWFFLAVFYSHSGFVSDVIKNNTSLHYLIQYAQLRHPIAFCLYSVTFITTIATLQTRHIRFQLNQLCWTILVICLILGQTMYIMHNIFNGLIWFTFPILLVVANDVFAYMAGKTFGKTFTNRPLTILSPNKTWEGFIGGWIGTVLFGWYLAPFLSQFSWMTCPTNQFTFRPAKLQCDIDPIFHQALILTGFTKQLIIPFQIHALVLSFFASLVAPFGGFLASAIKRAYGVKDFDSIIPGHGGIMDRVDCQFLMALYTWVHYNTFVRSHTVSVPKMIYMFNLLTAVEQKDFLDKITNTTITY